MSELRFGPGEITASEARVHADQSLGKSEGHRNPEHAIAAAIRGLAYAVLALSAPEFEVQETHKGRPVEEVKVRGGEV
jgi:hypothetical protein